MHEAPRTKAQVGRDLLENIHDSLPAEINSTTDAFDMLDILLDHTRALARALYGYDPIVEAANAAMTLAGIDEGEHVDVDRLHRIAEILKTGS